MHHKQEFALDLHQLAEISRDGSVVRSWLLDLASNALRDPQALQNIAAFVADSGEGRWTVFESVDLNVPAPVITLSLLQRLRSRESDSFSAKLLAALRNKFGGHEVKQRTGTTRLKSWAEYHPCPGALCQPTGRPHLQFFNGQRTPLMSARRLSGVQP